MSKVTIDKKEEHQTRKVYLGILIAILVLGAVFTVWYVQIRQTLLAEAGDQVNETVEEARWQMVEIEQMQKQIEQVIPGLNSDLDSMINGVRDAVRQQVVESRALDTVAQELAEDLSTQNSIIETNNEAVATAEMATIENATLE